MLIRMMNVFVCKEGKVLKNNKLTSSLGLVFLWFNSIKLNLKVYMNFQKG